MIKRRTILLALIILMALASASWAASPKNVILMIGDGMGLATVTLARLSLAPPATSLNMDSMKYTGFAQTHAANATVTDSAAAGTALATGYKTNNGMISTLPDGTVVQTILEAAFRKNKSTGLVTNVTITHATPAVFGSHVDARADEGAIAPQYLDRKIDVLMGGGKQFFIPKSMEGSKRTDERDLLAEAKTAGYSVVDTPEAMTGVTTGKLLGLFQMGALSADGPVPPLADMTGKAIELLSQDKDGFFLMIEGGQIDWQAHNNDQAGTVRHMMDLDVAIAKALEFARKKGNTLVIVTADHETGGLTLIYPDAGSTDKFKCAWTTKGHSGCNVPILADGPGAEMFTGVLDNTDIPKRIAKLWGIPAFGSR
jgi:alkaline phosphatase